MYRVSNPFDVPEYYTNNGLFLQLLNTDDPHNPVQQPVPDANFFEKHPYCISSSTSISNTVSIMDYSHSLRGP